MSLPAMSGPLRFLHAEDNPKDCELVEALLKQEWPDCVVECLPTRGEFIAALQGRYDLIISDFSMPAFGGMEALRLAQQKNATIPFVFLSGTIEENAIEALKLGATDYVSKDRMNRLVPAIRRALANVHEQRLRQEAEENLRTQAHWLDAARDAIYVSDLAGHLTYLNQSAGQLHGWTLAQAQGRPLRELFGLFSLALLPVALQQVQREGSWVGEIQTTTADGSLRQLESRWTLIRDPARRPRSILIISTDVTERRQLETQLRRSQRIESLGMLAGGIAHDLNNMLAPILMGVGLLRQKSNQPDVIRLADIIDRSAQKGASLVQQVLVFARGEEGERRPLAIGPVINDALTLLAETLPRAIQIREEISAGLWPIRADATQLNQVLINLGVNARDAMPSGGRLVFSAANTIVDPATAALHAGAQPGEHVVVSVTDTGLGIPPEVIERIFDPFFTTKALGKGTGLGLSTVLGIMKAHGGFMTVESKTGQGTAFRLFFPAEHAAPALDQAVAPAVPRGHGETILVIDDEESICLTVQASLEHFGYRAYAASDGAAGVELLRQNPEAKLILTDMMMPGLQTSGLLQELRALQPAIKIVLMTGLIAPDHQEKIATFGCTGFLQKPMTSEALAHAVHAALTAPAP